MFPTQGRRGWGGGVKAVTEETVGTMGAGGSIWLLTVIVHRLQILSRSLWVLQNPLLQLTKYQEPLCEHVREHVAYLHVWL